MSSKKRKNVLAESSQTNVEPQAKKTKESVDPEVTLEKSLNDHSCKSGQYIYNFYFSAKLLQMAKKRLDPRVERMLENG